MKKEDYYRSLIIYGLTDEDFDNLGNFSGWMFKKTLDTGAAYIFQNIEIGVEIYFCEKSKGVYQSANVLPLDASKINSSRYEEGFDSADNQMEDIKDDILYRFCLLFNKMARRSMIGTDRLWLCAIVPSIADTRDEY